MQVEVVLPSSSAVPRSLAVLRGEIVFHGERGHESWLPDKVIIVSRRRRPGCYVFMVCSPTITERDKTWSL